MASNERKQVSLIGLSLLTPERLKGYERVTNPTDLAPLVQELSNIFRSPFELTRGYKLGEINTRIQNASTPLELEELRSHLMRQVFLQGISELPGNVYSLLVGSGEHLSYNENSANDIYIPSYPERVDELTGVKNRIDVPRPVAYTIDDYSGEATQVFFTTIEKDTSANVALMHAAVRSQEYTSEEWEGILLLPADAEVEAAVAEAIDITSEATPSASWRAITLPIPLARISSIVDTITENRIVEKRNALEQSGFVSDTVIRKCVAEKREEGLREHWERSEPQGYSINNAFTACMSKLPRMSSLSEQNRIGYLTESLKSYYFKELSFYFLRGRDVERSLVPSKATASIINKSLEESGFLVTDAPRTKKKKRTNNFGISPKIITNNISSEEVAKDFVMPDGIVIDNKRGKSIESVYFYISDIDSPEDILKKVESVIFLHRMRPSLFTHDCMISFFTASNVSRDTFQAINQVTDLDSPFSMQQMMLPFTRQKPFSRIWGSMVDALLARKEKARHQESMLESIEEMQQPEKEQKTRTIVTLGGFLSDEIEVSIARNKRNFVGKLDRTFPVIKKAVAGLNALTPEYYEVLQSSIGKDVVPVTLEEEYQQQETFNSKAAPLRVLRSSYLRVLTQGLTHDEFQFFITDIRNGILEIAKQHREHVVNYLKRIQPQIDREIEKSQGKGAIIGAPLLRTYVAYALSLLQEKYKDESSIEVTAAGIFHPKYLPYGTTAVQEVLKIYKEDQKEEDVEGVLSEEVCLRFAWEDLLYDAFEIDFSKVENNNKDDLFASARLITDLFTITEMQELLVAGEGYVEKSAFEKELSDAKNLAITEKQKARRHQPRPFQKAYDDLVKQREAHRDLIKKAIRDAVLSKLPTETGDEATGELLDDAVEQSELPLQELVKARQLFLQYSPFK